MSIASLPPKVFISYSHDSAAHKDRVLALADRLRDDGIDCNIDQYEQSPPVGWHRWMLNEVEAADLVLVVCSETYDRRFRGQEEAGKGKGAIWEGGVIIQELYDAQGVNSKFIPIVLTADDSKFIPSPLRSATYYRVIAANDYELLYRRLTNQHSTPKQEIGKFRQLDKRDRQQLFPDVLPADPNPANPTPTGLTPFQEQQNKELLTIIDNVIKNRSTQLDLSNRGLTFVPKEIGKLTSLCWLNLSRNHLKSLPAEIGELTGLKTLDLASNELKSLPVEMGQLINLTLLYLDSNPSLSLPPEIRERGCRGIINFYRQQLEQETDRLYEAKLLIIGEGDAGKTTLAKKIKSSDYQLQKEDSTQGIDISQWQFTLENGEEFRVNIWDFGGQEIYHTTHQFFLTKRSLYALVVDNRKEDTDFYYWLNSVKLLSDNSPLLIIKNEQQDRQREINERQLRGEFINLKETLSTNLAINKGLPEIITQIKHYISNLPHVGTELPKTWIKVREALEQNSHNYISLDEYLNLCEENGFKRREDKLQLSGYLHDLGVCLHFQEDELLIKTVILKPTWGTDAVYKVLDNPQVKISQGRFTRDDLKNIWHEDKYSMMESELLRLMMNFKLCYEIPHSPKTYIAPQWLTPNQPDYTWDESDNLLLRYEYEFMPKGILTRFIVEMHGWIEEQSHVWKSGVILVKEGARAEVIERYLYHKGEIRIRVSGKWQRNLLTTIRDGFSKIHNSYNSVDDRSNRVQRLKYSTLVPCNCLTTCKNSQDPYFYPLERLYKCLDTQENIQCQNSFKMVSVRSLIDDITPEVGARINNQRRRTKKQQESLQKEWELRQEKLTFLRLELATETDTARKFQLENQTRIAEVKLKELEDRLNLIYQKLD
jgi:internalin A